MSHGNQDDDSSSDCGLSCAGYCACHGSSHCQRCGMELMQGRCACRPGWKIMRALGLVFLLWAAFQFAVSLTIWLWRWMAL